MNRKPVSILFLCTGNSARSILAEALLNHLAKGRFLAASAGSQPAGRVHPQALALLGAMGLPTAGLRSKSWAEFERPGLPPIDIVITVCDSAAREACPVWPGKPVTAHWGLSDPAAAGEDEAVLARAFAETRDRLTARIEQLLALPIEDMELPALRAALNRIGQDRSAA